MQGEINKFTIIVKRFQHPLLTTGRTRDRNRRKLPQS